MISVHFCVAQRLADSLRPLSSDLDEALEVFAPSHDFFSSRVRRQKLGLRTWDAEADGRGDVATNESSEGRTKRTKYVEVEDGILS